MDGVLLINKPKGWTSRDVVNKVGSIFETRKVGHAGTLDPIATGVLVVCLGKYTKLVELLTSHEKEYIATMRLGIRTDTMDITGNTIEQHKVEVSKDVIQDAFQNFPREYLQKVPKYSAVKVHGKKLYEYAREGKDVIVPSRNVNTHLELLKIEKDEITFLARVSKGTYIRSLIEDIAASFSNIATMTELTRVKSGNFLLKDCKNIEEISKSEKLLVLDDLFSYPKILIDDVILKKVQNGNRLRLDSNESRVLLSYKNTAVAIYERDQHEYKMIFKIV